MKVEITPNDRESIAVAGQVTPNLLQNFNVYDDISIVNSWTVPAYQQRYTSETFSQLSPDKAQVIYRNNRPLARSQNTAWFDANPPAFSTSTGGPRAVTVIGWRVVDEQQQPPGTNYGSIRVTWYVTFRGQRVQ